MGGKVAGYNGKETDGWGCWAYKLVFFGNLVLVFLLE